MKKYLIVLALVGVVSTSCYEKLIVSPPNSITSEQIRETLENASDAEREAIMSAMAASLAPQFKKGGLSNFNDQYAGSYQGQDVLRNLSANDMVLGNTAPSGDAGNYYSGTVVRGANNTLPWWQHGYFIIHEANKIAPDINEDLVAVMPIASRYLGWLYATRAYGYLLLLESFGSTDNGLGVPIYTVYNVGQPLKARATYQETCDSVTTWLKRAVELLEASNMGFAGDGNGVINEGVVNFMLARASLYAEDYATVITACDKIIANYALMTEAQYVMKDTRPAGLAYPIYNANLNGFKNLAQNPEYILGWTNANKAYGYFETWMNAFNGVMRIDRRLYEMIDANDYRKDNFIPAGLGALYSPGTGSLIDGTNVTTGTYINVKFANNIGVGGSLRADPMTTTSTEARKGETDYVQWRLAEAYLMKAEAQAASGDEPGAKITMNTLLAARTRTGAPALTFDTYDYGVTGLTTMEKIRYQYRIELWGENGRDWFNSKRWRTGIDRSGANSLHHNTTMTFPANQMAVQLPTNEMENNPLAVQNQ